MNSAVLTTSRRRGGLISVKQARAGRRERERLVSSFAATWGTNDPPENAPVRTSDVHPNAPAGGGGPGYFRNAGCLNGPSDSATDDCIRSPGVRHDVNLADGSTTPLATPQAPPATVPKREVVEKRTTDDVDIQVHVEVLADTTNSKLRPGSAKTSFNAKGVTSAVPGYDTAGGKVTKFRGKFKIQGTVIIQTAYGPRAKASDLSGYGRGTTTDDEKAGNVTLGFHESCHQVDFLEYLKDNALPEFGGEVGMSPGEFTAAGRKFQQDFNDYWTAGETFSENRTDEVGYKLSEYEKLGPRTP